MELIVAMAASGGRGRGKTPTPIESWWERKGEKTPPTPVQSFWKRGHGAALTYSEMVQDYVRRLPEDKIAPMANWLGTLQIEPASEDLEALVRGSPMVINIVASKRVVGAPTEYEAFFLSADRYRELEQDLREGHQAFSTRYKEAFRQYRSGFHSERMGPFPLLVLVGNLQMTRYARFNYGLISDASIVRVVISNTPDLRDRQYRSLFASEKKGMVGGYLALRK